MTHTAPTQNDREEMFREYQSEHLRRQTKALEGIRTLLAVLMALVVLGVVLQVTASAIGV